MKIKERNFKKLILIIVLVLFSITCIICCYRNINLYNKYIKNYNLDFTNTNIINLINNKEEHKYKLKQSKLNNFQELYKENRTEEEISTYSNNIKNITLIHNKEAKQFKNIFQSHGFGNYNELKISINTKQSSNIENEIFTFAQQFSSKKTKNFILENYEEINRKKYNKYIKIETEKFVVCSIKKDKNILEIDWIIKYPQTSDIFLFLFLFLTIFIVSTTLFTKYLILLKKRRKETMLHTQQSEKK